MDWSNTLRPDRILQLMLTSSAHLYRSAQWLSKIMQHYLSNKGYLSYMMEKGAYQYQRFHLLDKAVTVELSGVLKWKMHFELVPLWRKWKDVDVKGNALLIWLVSTSSKDVVLDMAQVSGGVTFSGAISNHHLFLSILFCHQSFI